MPKALAYQTVLELFLQSANAPRIAVPFNIETVDEIRFQSKPAGITREIIENDAITITSHNLPDNLSAKAFKLVWKIMKELKLNNALWFFDSSTSTWDAMAIKELREVDILYKTEDRHIHIVNAFFIRRGSRDAVLATTAAMLGRAGRLDTGCIRDLRPIKEMPRLR